MQVLPYSGVMLEMHVRCVALSASRPGPKHSTKQPTTPFARSICANDSATSMAATPSPSSPLRRTPTTFGTSVSKYAVGCSPGAPSAVMVTWANCSMFSWWQMPAPGGTMRTFSNDSRDHFKKS